MKNGIPNFDQFIEYIMENEKNTNIMEDPHLALFWQKCDMCKVHYDIIGKAETSPCKFNMVLKFR